MIGRLWVSPKCPKLPPGSCQTDGESSTGFKTALLKYLNNYKNDDQKIPTLQGWIDAVAGTDFSEVKLVSFTTMVYFLAEAIFLVLIF